MYLGNGVYFRFIDQVKWEAWSEEYIQLDYIEICTANGFLHAEEYLLDKIETHPSFRNMGYAETLLEQMKEKGFKVRPINIQEEAKGFWVKMKERKLCDF